MKIIRLKELREDHDLTQTSLSKILHISQRAYSHYENGSREIPIELLIQLSHLYKTSVDYILGETDIRKRYPASKHKNTQNF